MKRIKQTLTAIMLTLLAISTAACATESQTRISMNTHHTTLWQLIETLIDYPPFTLDTIRQALPVELSERHRTASFSSYVGGRLHLADQVVVGPIELRIRHKDGISRLLVISIGDTTCITVDEVRTHYPDITPVPPRGHMLIDANFYSARKPWGLLTFGFADRAHPCLASVVLDRIEASRSQPK